MAKKKRVDPIKQREKRAKIGAIAGVLVLALVASYEIPSMMKTLNKKPPPPPAARAQPVTGSTAEGLPNIASGASASPSASSATSGQLVDTDLPPTSSDGQLVSFSIFATKNPFRPQVSTQQTPSASAAATSTTPSTADKRGADVPASTATTATTTPGAPGGSVVPSAQPAGATTTAAQGPAVAISVNGVVSHVASQGTFPSGKPVFRLAGWTRDTAQIAIVGGSYATGGVTLTLHIGQALTLENQTDGKRYTLELVSTP